MLSKILANVAAVLILLSGFSAQLAASTVEVGTCIPNLVHFDTIQDAVNGVPAASTIEVCPGTYPEQVTITQPLALKGVQSGTADMAVITSPIGGMVLNIGGIYAAGLAVSNTTGVNISNLVVDGANNGITSCMNPVLAGVFYLNASGSVSHVVTRNQVLSFDGCGFGTDAIRVRTDAGFSSSVSIQNNTLHHFQSNGIYASGAGTTVTIKGNSILGLGASQTGGNGIFLALGASGTILSNTVLDLIWAPDAFPDFFDASYGVLLQCSQNVTISGNTVGNTQAGIVLSSVACQSIYPNPDNNTISLNKIFGTQLYDAINICGSNNVIESNTIMAADQSAVHLFSDLDTTNCPSSNDPGNNNTVSLNTINDAGCAGIIVDGNTGGNILSTNFFSDVAATALNPGVWCASSTAGAKPAPPQNWRADLQRLLR